MTLGMTSAFSSEFELPKMLAGAPGRHILYEGGVFRMKEANGEEVKLTENGTEYLVEPAADQIDDLGRARVGSGSNGR